MTDLPQSRQWSAALAHSLNAPVIAIVMGVSGSGKTTVAALLAAALGCQFQEGDDLHPAANVEKMHSGTPLTDADRLPWLQKIAEEIDGWRARGESGVLTCSALKRSYRDIVIGDRKDVSLVYLKGSYDLIHRRMAARHGHFMPVALLDSQFEALEEPTLDENPIVVDIGPRPADIATEIVRQLEKKQSKVAGESGLRRKGTMTDSGVRFEVLPDLEALSRRVAEWMVDEAAKTDGPFSIALSGGSTPRRLYELLADEPYRGKFPWDRTHWFWGDERFVPHDDKRSNYRMAHEALLARAPIPAANIHAVPTEGLTAEEAASAYARELKTFYGAERLDMARPLFDVNLLGIGEDGHTASLFPGTKALGERERWVTSVVGAQPETRITLTYPALESSRNAVFLIAGAKKREPLAGLRRGDARLPAANLHPTGTLWIFADAAAAGALAPKAP